jgi:hypothetical protein
MAKPLWLTTSKLQKKPSRKLLKPEPDLEPLPMVDLHSILSDASNQWIASEFHKEMQRNCAIVAPFVPEAEHQYLEGSYKMLMLAGAHPAGTA